jgi:heme-degrading monooxygenase HmoA
MFVLHVDLQLKAGAERELENTYREIFQPAISRQPGFHSVALLRPRDETGNYLLSIVFEDQSHQQKWVATDLHQQVWPQMEIHCASYAVKNYDAV